MVLVYSRKCVCTLGGYTLLRSVFPPAPATLYRRTALFEWQNYYRLWQKCLYRGSFYNMRKFKHEMALDNFVKSILSCNEVERILLFLSTWFCNCVFVFVAKKKKKKDKVGKGEKKGSTMCNLYTAQPLSWSNACHFYTRSLCIFFQHFLFSLYSSISVFFCSNFVTLSTFGTFLTVLEIDTEARRCWLWW